MAVNVTYPGVYIQELPSAVHPITGVATSIGAFVGYTARGIDNRAEQIFSFSDYERLFGGLASDSELSYAAQQFFANGGNEAYVVRAPRTGAKGAQVVFGGLTFTALSSGTWANGELLIDVDYSGLAQGLAGTVALTKTNATVTGTGTFFTTALKVNQWLVFGSDSTQTPYQIKTISSDTSLTLTAGFGGSTTASAAYVEWRLRRAWAPLLFEDEERREERQRRDPILAAEPSDSAEAKKHSHKTAKGLPVHSFQTLLAELASRARVTYEFKSGAAKLTFQQTPEPTPLQAQAYELIRTFPVTGN
jgi:hypothetical protein